MKKDEIFKLNVEPKFKIGQVVKVIFDPGRETANYPVIIKAIYLHDVEGVFSFYYGCTSEIDNPKWWDNPTDCYPAETYIEEIEL